MDKYIGFDIDDKHTVSCIVEKGKKDRFLKFKTDIKAMRNYLGQQKTDNSRIHLTFEISGQAGHLYDSLQGYADTITVSNPSQMTWIYRTSKKNDRIDARKQAVLLSILMTIPGVGPRTTEAVLAYTDDISRFKRTKQYCAYFGVTPKLDESGSTRRLGHISKQGPSVVRWLIAESAWQIIKKSPSMKSFYERVMSGQPSRKKIAVVAVMRKLFGIMRAMLMTGEIYNEDLVCRQINEKCIMKQTA